MSEADDMVREMCAAFEAVLGVKPSEEQRLEIQSRVVEQFGGERIYVPKRLSRPRMDGPLTLHTMDPIREIMRRYRVSYTTAWRMVRSRR